MVIMKLFIMKKSELVVICIVLLLMGICQAGTGMNIIAPGGTVFLGEEGLDISAAKVYDGSRIGWWAPGSSRSNEPTEIISITSPNSYYISPSLFSGKEGLWYLWPEGNPVFQVKKPQISLRIHDETADFDATGKWVPRGDAISFKISSNVYEANSRGGSGGQADIVLTSPEGAKYSSVSGPSGSFSLSGIPLTSSLTSTGPVWSTGGAAVGTWTIQAELSMNRIKDNIQEIGIGISAPVNVLIQNVNPLIKSPVAVNIETPSKEVIPVPTKTENPSVSVPVTKPAKLIPTQKTQITQSPTPELTLTQVPSVASTSPVTIDPTPIDTPVSTPVPVKTQTPLGIAPIIGTFLILIFLRRF